MEKVVLLIASGITNFQYDPLPVRPVSHYVNYLIYLQAILVCESFSI